MRVPVQICAAGPEAPGGTLLKVWLSFKLPWYLGSIFADVKQTECVKARKGLEVAQHALQRRLCSVLWSSLPIL
jgi:hypothetical protein